MASRKQQKQSAPISLDDVLNADSIKGQYVVADEKATTKTLSNLAKYPDLHVLQDRGVMALVDERKRAVVAECNSCHTPFLLRTSDAFQVKGLCPTCRRGAKAIKQDEEKREAHMSDAGRAPRTRKIAKGRTAKGSRKSRKGGAR